MFQTITELQEYLHSIFGFCGIIFGFFIDNSCQNYKL